MAGRVLTEDDFEEGKDPKDTSDKTPPPDEVIEGKEKEEPKEEEKPSEDKEEPQPKPSDDKKYKYASMDEFDKAYKEAERKMHESTTEAAELRRKVAQYEKPKEEIVTIDDRIRIMTKDTLNKIKTLPADSASRDEDAGYLWSKLQSDIADVKYEERSRAQDTERSNIKKLFDRAVVEGLKTDEEMEWVGNQFSKTDPRDSMDERIKSAVSAAKAKLTKLREGLVEKPDPEKLEKDRKDKENLKVLGRGSSRREKSEEDDKKPTSMSQQLADLNEKRRIKKDDLWR